MDRDPAAGSLHAGSLQDRVPIDGGPRTSRPAGGAAGSSEARQRWRVVFSRVPDAEALSQRDVAAALDEGLAASGLPIVTGGEGRRRSPVAFGAPLPTRMPVERELADVFLADRLPVHEVRARLAAAFPPGFELIDVHDVWLGEPPLPAQVAAGDYRIVLARDHPPAEVLASAAARLLASRTLPRTRMKGDRTVTYDLRPLLVSIAVRRPGPPAELLMRTRFHNELGTGRPEEVVGALSEATGVALAAASTVRERLVLAGDL